MSVLPRMWPSGWEARPAWDVLESRDEFGGLREQLSLSVVHGIRPRDAGEGRAASDTTAHYRVVRRGDLVINRLVARDGAVAVSPLDGLISPAYWVMRPRRPDDDVRFIGYQLRSAVYLAEIARLSKDMPPAQFDLPWEQFRGMPLALPSVAEQGAIADFLDTETARIDALIAKKGAMLELLEERARSRLSVVTTGLDLDVPLEPTRSLWYPALPEGWRVAKVRFLTDAIADGPHVSPTYVAEGGVLFISVRNIRVDGWDFTTAKRISGEDYDLFSRRVKPESGDVLLTKGGTTGVARMVDFAEPFQVWVHVAVLKIRKELIHPGFLAAALNSTSAYAQSQLYTRGATNQDLALGRIAEIEVPLPPRDQQEGLVATLRTQDRQQVALREKLGRQVELLREHRQALITAAVTGDFDVPGVAA